MVRSVLGLSITEPVPFARLPIAWERAFGGSGRTPETSGQTLRAAIRPGPALLHTKISTGTPLPNVEYPEDPVRSARSQHGAGRLLEQSHPRGVRGAELGGTFDDEWRASRSPLWPLDCDPRHHLAAPADQVSPKPFPRRRARRCPTNLTPDAPHAGAAARRSIAPSTPIFAAAARQHRAQLDQRHRQPDDRGLVMVWRTALPCGSDSRAVEATMIETKRVIH